MASDEGIHKEIKYSHQGSVLKTSIRDVGEILFVGPKVSSEGTEAIPHLKETTSALFVVKTRLSSECDVCR